MFEKLLGAIDDVCTCGIAGFAEPRTEAGGIGAVLAEFQIGRSAQRGRERLAIRPLELDVGVRMTP
jgi:hypothetical protein